MAKMEFVTVEVAEVKAVTAKAALIELKSNNDEIWIPLSVLASDDAEEIYRGEKDIELRVHDWFADKEGLV